MDLFEASEYIEHARNNYRQVLLYVLDEGPGGRNYNENTFDLMKYKRHVESLRLSHTHAKVSLSGIPSIEEESWGWNEQRFATYFMSPLNMTRLAEQFEMYNELKKHDDVSGFVLGQKIQLKETDAAKSLSDTFNAKIIGFKAGGEFLGVQFLGNLKTMWIGPSQIA